MERRAWTLGTGLPRVLGAGLWWSAISLSAVPQVDSRGSWLADWVVATTFFITLFAAPAFLVEALLARRRPPRHVPIALLAAVGLSCFLLFDTTGFNPLGLVIAAVLNGAGLVTLAALFAHEPSLSWLSGRFGPHRRLAALCGPAVLAVFIALVAWPGPGAPPGQVSSAGGVVPVIDAPNPGAMGTYTYTRLTYGPEAQDGRVDLVSRRVDASAIIPDWHDAFLDTRTRYWGFDASRIPVAGTIWLPAGEGPFPLMLLVHGQTAMVTPSDQGLAYLGEFLASHGYVAASTHANFLNTNWFAMMLVPGLTLQDDFGARGWLLLEHVKQWRDWQITPGNALSGKIDLQQLALIGHSRGGEAAALVADYNSRFGQPPDTKVRALVSLSPTDANFLPGGERIRLSGLSYLVISSGYDGDVVSALGINQYQRVDVGPENYFKASVFLEHATHNGFNSVWNGSNAASPGSLLTNRAPLMPAVDQQQATKVFIGAFFEDAFRHRSAFERVFRDHRAGGAWLPASASYRSVLYRAEDLLVDDFEDEHSETPSIPGGHNRWAGPVAGSEGQAPLLAAVNGPASYHESKVAFMAWRQPGGSYETTIPVSQTAAWGSGPGRALALNLAHASRLTGTAPGDDADRPLDFTVFIRDAAGKEGRLPLTYLEPLRPPLEVRLFKVDLYPIWPNVFDQFVLPLAEFRPTGGSLDLGQLAAVGLRFDRSARGAIFIDDITLCRR